jgi:pyruvate,water dikinase
MVTWQDSESWQLDAVHCFRPVYPLEDSFFFETFGPGTESAFTAWSFPLERIRCKVFNGWVYTRHDVYDGGEPLTLPGNNASTPRSDSRIWQRLQDFDRFVRGQGFERHLQIWEEKWLSEAERRLASLRAFDLARASNARLADHFDAWYHHMVWSYSVHIPLHLVSLYVRGRFAEVFRRLLGLTDAEAYDLLARADTALYGAARSILSIARRAAFDSIVREALGKPSEQALRELKGSWFEVVLNEFIDTEGDRPSGFGLAEPTWRERPELVVELIKGHLDGACYFGADDSMLHAQRQERVDELKASLSLEERAHFDHWLVLGHQAYQLNESHDRLLVEIPLGLVRYAALAAGRRLAEAGKLREPADVFHLYRSELMSSLRGTALPDGLVASRAEKHRVNQTLKPPGVIGEPPSPPPLENLPSAAAAALRIVTSQLAEINGGAADERQDGLLSGGKGSPGLAEGPARIVKAPDEFESVRVGDVLVCSTTMPALVSLFPRIAALITDTGGTLCHAAIIAREFGLPAVVGATDATRRLKNGQIVRVNGSDGTVQIL